MKLVLFRDINRKARIRLVADNGRIIMSSEAYSSKANAKQTVKAVLKAKSIKFVDEEAAKQ